MNIKELIEQSGFDLNEARKDIQEDIIEMEQELNKLKMIVNNDVELFKFVVQEEIDELKSKKGKKAQQEALELEEILKQVQ